MKRLGTYLSILLVVAAVYAAFMIFPHYLDFYQFQDDINNEAKFARQGNMNDEKILNNVMKEANSYALPITPDMVRISHEGENTSIAVDYTITVRFPMDKQVVLDFHPRSQVTY